MVCVWLVVGWLGVGWWVGGGGWEVGDGWLVVGRWVLGRSRSRRSGSRLWLQPDQKVLWFRLRLRNPAENYAKRSEKFLRKSLKRKKAKRSEKCCENLWSEKKRKIWSEKKRKFLLVSFVKQSENQAKLDALLLFLLWSEKIKQAKMGHPTVDISVNNLANYSQLCSTVRWTQFLIE